MLKYLYEWWFGPPNHKEAIAIAISRDTLRLLGSVTDQELARVPGQIDDHDLDDVADMCPKSNMGYGKPVIVYNAHNGQKFLRFGEDCYHADSGHISYSKWIAQEYARLNPPKPEDVV